MGYELHRPQISRRFILHKLWISSRFTIHRTRISRTFEIIQEIQDFQVIQEYPGDSCPFRPWIYMRFANIQEICKYTGDSGPEYPWDLQIYRWFVRQRPRNLWDLRLIGHKCSQIYKCFVLDSRQFLKTKVWSIPRIHLDSSVDMTSCHKLLTKSDFWREREPQWQENGWNPKNFWKESNCTIIIFKKKKFEIMCHMMGCNDSSG